MTAEYTRIKIALVDGCNLSCSHCYMGKMKETTNRYQNVVKRIDEAAGLGVEVLDFTGGEPTQHPEIISLIDYAGSKNFYTINLSTNGMAIGKNRLFDAILRNNVVCNISLDGASAETVDRIRGKNVFRRLEKVFAMLHENHCSFSLRFSINRMNCEEINEIIDYGERWGVKIDLEPTQKIGNAIRKFSCNR